MNFGNNVNINNNLVLVPRTSDPISPVNGEIWYNSTLSKFRKYQNGVISDLDTTGGGGGVSALKYIDQTPDNGTYGLLSGTVNGTNKIFTVSQSEYLTGKLEVYLNGVLQTQGVSNDFVELNPAAGTFEFVTAPPTNSIITATYITEEPGGSLPTLTSGSIVFSDGVTLAEDNANLFWDNANNRLGVGTNTPNVSSIADFSSTTGGLLVPRMTTTQRNTIGSPAEGLQIYNTTKKCIETYDSFWGWVGVNNPNEHLEYFRFFTDFVTNISSTSTNDGGGLAISINGTGTSITNIETEEANRVGLIRCSTGTTATGRAPITTSKSFGLAAGGIMVVEFSMRLNQLSDSTDGFQLVFGLLNANNSGTQTPSVAFVYDSEGALSSNSGSPYWKVSANGRNNVGGVFVNYTVIPGDIIPSINTWDKFRIEIYDVSSVPTAHYFINDTLVHTMNSLIPLITENLLNDLVFGVYFQKNVGTTPCTIDFDYFKMDYKFSTPR